MISSELFTTLEIAQRVASKKPHVEDSLVPLADDFGYAGALQLIRRSRVFSKRTPPKSRRGRSLRHEYAQIVERGHLPAGSGFRRFGKMPNRETMPRAVSAGLTANF
jgi:hypothetical protein